MLTDYLEFPYSCKLVNNVSFSLLFVRLIRKFHLVLIKTYRNTMRILVHV